MAINTIGSSSGSPPVPAVPSGGSPAPVPSRPAVASPAPVPQQPSPEQVRKTVQQMKELVQPTAANSLQFSIDDATGKTIVRVTDVQTGEMIRQIPSEELLEIARSLDKMQGLLLKQKA